MKVHAGQILPCGQVTGNKEFTIGGLMSSVGYSNSMNTVMDAYGGSLLMSERGYS